MISGTYLRIEAREIKFIQFSQIHSPLHQFGPKSIRTNPMNTSPMHSIPENARKTRGGALEQITEN